MRGLPVQLNVSGRAALVVGGGSVAVRRARSLIDAGALVRVVAPRVDAAMDSLSVSVQRRAYEPIDLAGAMLVVIATDDRAVNDRVHRDAQEAGVLVNRADDPEAGDFIVPAHAARGPVLLAVSTEGISAAAAAAIRDQLLERLDEDWITLLSEAGQCRGEIQACASDAAARQGLLRRLTDDKSMQMLKNEGLDSLRRHLKEVVAEARRIGDRES